MEEKMEVAAVIPARYGSSRFPGKPLKKIMGKPMVQWVYEGTLSSGCVDYVVVATDDQQIYDLVCSFGGNVCMTGECKCGTECVYEAVRDIDCNIVINVQGDEPLIDGRAVTQIAESFSDKRTVMSTLKREFDPEEDVTDPNIVKVITDTEDNAIYFSRSVIPYDRDNKIVRYYKHIGIYGYRKDFLKKYVKMERSILEQAESLEQLRVIENGYKIKVIETEYNGLGVDVPEDITKVETLLRNRK